MSIDMLQFKVMVRVDGAPSIHMGVTPHHVRDELCLRACGTF